MKISLFDTPPADQPFARRYRLYAKSQTNYIFSTPCRQAFPSFPWESIYYAGDWNLKQKIMFGLSGF